MGKRNRGSLIRETYENGKLIYVDVFTGKKYTYEEFPRLKEYLDFSYRVKKHRERKKEREKEWKKYMKELEKNKKKFKAKKLDKYYY